MTPRATPAPGLPAVDAVDLAVGRDRPVLAGITLAVRPGERVALVGANGSGKTTLLRTLAGLDRPLAGRIAWAGGPLPEGAGRVRRVGVLFQTEPCSRFTVRELVTLGLGLDGPPGPAARRAVDDALARAALTGLAGRPCTHLSGGELQRALLARALVATPQLILLDEPTNHLDPAGKAMIQALIEQVSGHQTGVLPGRRSTSASSLAPDLHAGLAPDHASGLAPGLAPGHASGLAPDHASGLAPPPTSGGVAVVIATHDLALAASCDRVALLSGGGLAAIGAPAAVLTPEHLARALGVVVRRLDDPDGGPPVFRIVAPAPAIPPAHEVAA